MPRSGAAAPPSSKLPASMMCASLSSPFSSTSASAPIPQLARCARARADTRECVALTHRSSTTPRPPFVRPSLIAHHSYSFGILLAAIVTGDLPYAGAANAGYGALEVTLSAIADPAVQLRPDRPTGAGGVLARWTARVPPRFLRLVRLCWAHNPEERPLFPWIEQELLGIASSLAREYS